MKIIVLKESTDFATLDTEKLFSKLKSHELSRNGHPNHDASLSSKALITSACVGGHDASPTNTTISSALKFVLSSLSATSNEQYETIPNDKIALLVRKFRASIRRGGDHLGAASSAMTPPISSLTALRGRSSTPPSISTTTPSGMTTARATIRRSIASGTRRRRRSSRR
jgi:hypothetical protein